jgi:hypothetical protein
MHLEPHSRKGPCKGLHLVVQRHELGVVLRAVLQGRLKVLELAARLLLHLLGDAHGAVEVGGHLLEVLLSEPSVCHNTSHNMHRIHTQFSKKEKDKWV